VYSTTDKSIEDSSRNNEKNGSDAQMDFLVQE